MKIAEEIIAALRKAKRVAVLTGAGISAESGVPTFREAQTGLWEQYNPEDLATPEAFQRTPKLVWDWYAWRRGLVANVQPNAGHLALVELEKLVPTFSLITQNVDGLHQRAGSRFVVELHGNITRTKCLAEDVVVPEWPATDQVPPLCPRCGGMLRPDVVWFGENLPPAALRSAEQASRECEVFLCIGTSGMVYPAAGLPMKALQAGAMMVEINPQRTPLSSSATHVLSGASGSILPELVRMMKAG